MGTKLNSLDRIYTFDYISNYTYDYRLNPVTFKLHSNERTDYFRSQLRLQNSYGRCLIDDDDQGSAYRWSIGDISRSTRRESVNLERDEGKERKKETRARVCV